MIGTQRQQEILEYLEQYQTVSVKQIVKKFFVSEATARRDLEALEKTGLIRRVFGGATLIIGSDKQVPLFVREREDGDEKDILCQRASAFIEDGNIIFLDGSSTVQFLVPYLKKFKDLVVVTNGLKIAQMLSELHIKVYLCGGLLMENSSVIVGQDAEEFISNFNADICIISCKGLSEDGKLTDTSYEETKLRKRYLKNAKKKVALITAHKIGKKYIHTLCDKDDLDHLIVAKEPNLTAVKGE
jgi:DeoR/GlpR family transcriptional regulator of sugar metabolism